VWATSSRHPAFKRSPNSFVEPTAATNRKEMESEDHRRAGAVLNDTAISCVASVAYSLD
jgi:hypothetical protein